MNFIKKRPIYLTLNDFKILHLILTEREIEDREDGLQPQTREIDLSLKINKIIEVMSKAEAFRARQRAAAPVLSRGDYKPADSRVDDFRDHYFTRDR